MLLIVALGVLTLALALPACDDFGGGGSPDGQHDEHEHHEGDGHDHGHDDDHADAADLTLPYADAETIDALAADAAAKDQILVVDFWATWCVPCIKMFGPLHEGLAALGEDVRQVSVSLDSPDRLDLVTKFLREHHALENAYLAVPDSAKQTAMGERWQALAVPVILVFDQQGNLAGNFRDGRVEPVLGSVSQLVNRTTLTSN